MLKILYVSAMAERSGLEVVLLHILKALDRSRYKPLILLLEDGPFVKEVEATETEVHVIKSGRVRNVVKGALAVFDIVTLIKRKGIHLVHSHNPKAHLYGGLAAAFAGVPCIYHLHGVPSFTVSREGVLSLLSVMVRAQLTIANSNYVAEAFKKAWPSRRETRVVHNGVWIDPLAVSNGGPSVREEFGIPDGTPLVVMACRLQRWKGVHVFIDAAAQVVKVFPQTSFLVVGGTLFGLEEDYPTELRHQANSLGLGHAVLFTGYRPDVYRFLGAADLVVHVPVDPEPFGMVVVEAMAMGKAIIASDLGGPKEIVENGVTGLLIPPNQPHLLAQAIVKLLTDSELRERMGEVGAARAHSYYHAKRMVRQLETVYEQVIGDGPGNGC